jgi:hypothetical protein
VILERREDPLQAAENPVARELPGRIAIPVPPDRKTQERSRFPPLVYGLPTDLKVLRSRLRREDSTFGPKKLVSSPQTPQARSIERPFAMKKIERLGTFQKPEQELKIRGGGDDSAKGRLIHLLGQVNESGQAAFGEGAADDGSSKRPKPARQRRLRTFRWG